MGDTTSASVGNVLYPATDVGAAVEFYGRCLGLPVQFQDGDRFAMLDGGGTRIAIAGTAEDVTGGRVAASFKVDDVSSAVEAAIAAGGRVVRAAEEGPHEIRAVLVDPWDNTVVVYQKR